MDFWTWVWKNRRRLVIDYLLEKESKKIEDMLDRIISDGKRL